MTAAVVKGTGEVEKSAEVVPRKSKAAVPPRTASGVRVQGAGCRVQGAGFRVEGRLSPAHCVGGQR